AACTVIEPSFSVCGPGTSAALASEKMQPLRVSGYTSPSVPAPTAVNDTLQLVVLPRTELSTVPSTMVIVPAPSLTEHRPVPDPDALASSSVVGKLIVHW